jgi:hypothetical protein
VRPCGKGVGVGTDRVSTNAVELEYMSTKGGGKLLTSGWWGRSRHPVSRDVWVRSSLGLDDDVDTTMRTGGMDRITLGIGSWRKSRPVSVLSRTQGPITADPHRDHSLVAWHGVSLPVSPPPSLTFTSSSSSSSCCIDRSGTTRRVMKSTGRIGRFIARGFRSGSYPMS